MKVYISGKITGLPQDEVEQNFNRAEWLLEDIGVQPVNPVKNGLSGECSRKRHIARDIELLLECGGILMLTNWKDSKDAGIEYFIAKTQGMNILFESTIARDHEMAAKIQNAILEVTGMTSDRYLNKIRERERFFARMIFARHCHLNKIDVLRYIPHDRSIVYHYLNTYETEMKYNPKFREMANRVENILKVDN